jgi:hypothetical protein
VAGATSRFELAFRFCRLLFLFCFPFVEVLSYNLLEDVFRGGGGGIEDEGNGSGETESEECSL